MRRPPELHERFADWLASRPPGIAEEPPRDLALHAAACDRCLREATALDGLAAVAIGAIDAPRVPVPRERPAGLRSLGRYAVAGSTIVLAGAAVAVGSSLVADAPPPSDLAQAQSLGEGVLAGVPTVHLSVSPLPTPTPTATPTARPSPSPEGSDEASVEPAPIPTAAPPTARPLPIPVPTATPIAPPIAPPTASPTITATAAPTPSPAPPTPTPTLPPPTPIASPTAPPTESPLP